MDAKPVIKYGIDWTKIALEVNDARKKIIASGTRSAEAFNYAYMRVTKQHPVITGEAWKDGRKIVGQIMANWKNDKAKTAAKNKVAPVMKKTTKQKNGDDSIAVISKGDTYMCLSLGKQYVGVFKSTPKGGVTAILSCDGESCLQGAVPATLLKKARAVAEKHFHGDKKSGNLF